MKYNSFFNLGRKKAKEPKACSTCKFGKSTYTLWCMETTSFVSKLLPCANERANHTCTNYLSNLYLYGGYETAMFRKNSSLVAFDLGKNEIQELGKTAFPLHGHRALVHDQALFVFGGHTLVGCSNYFLVYKFATGQWQFLDYVVHVCLAGGDRKITLAM